jgi:hypothetical protein
MDDEHPHATSRIAIALVLALPLALALAIGCAARRVCECAVYIGGTPPATEDEERTRGRALDRCLAEHGGGTIQGCPMPAGMPTMPPEKPLASAAPPAGPVLRIWVTRDGQIEVDGAPADLSDVSRRLQELSRAKGVVFYGRDDAKTDPPPMGMEVIKLVVENRLPVRMSTKRDFSDVVDLRGRSAAP